MTHACWLVTYQAIGHAAAQFGTPLTLSVRVEGNTGIVTGINYVIGRDDKAQPFERRTRFTDVFVKRDGRWQVLSTQGTAIAPPANAQPATTAQKQ